MFRFPLLPIIIFVRLAVSAAFTFPAALRHDCLQTRQMVRNIDLPECVVFYGLSSLMEPPRLEEINEGFIHKIRFSLREGVKRLLNECKEVGTASLLLSEDEEDGLELMFQKAWERAIDSDGKGSKVLINSIHFRCLNSEFPLPPENDVSEADALDEYDEHIEFYNLQSRGRSPSPAFLLDCLRSVRIDPRGFGGSSGFSRGQWVEPRRCPMPTRTVVFVAGDWSPPLRRNEVDGKISKSFARDHCAAARAAGCRVVYLEQIKDDQTKKEGFVAIEDDAPTMALCDAVINTYGNDNPRDLIQPITLDAISTPGDYWLNPPTPRDDVGNSVNVDKLIDWFRSVRVLHGAVGNGRGAVSNEEENASKGEKMSEEDMKSILADLNRP